MRESMKIVTLITDRFIHNDKNIAGISKNILFICKPLIKNAETIALYLQINSSLFKEILITGPSSISRSEHLLI